MSSVEIAPLSAPAGSLDHTVSVPGSRSVTNRGLVCAALAEGTSRLKGWLDSDDTVAMRDGLGRMGVEVVESGADLLVRGTGGQLVIPMHPIDCAASGTTMRFLSAMAALVPGRTTLDGTPRMRERPIQDLADALTSLGATARTTAGCPPITINGGALRGGEIAVDASRSSQYLSALLMLAPLAPDPVSITASQITSRPYVDMTLDTMTAFGISVDQDSATRFRIQPQTYRARSYAVEPDASSASYFFGIAAITEGRVRVEGLTPASSQADIRFVEVLERMGCRAERGSGWTSVRGPRYLHGVDVDMNAMPDAAMTLAVIACFGQGTTTIRNIGNWRIKETDRMKAMKTELEKLGARVQVHEDDMQIEPPETVQAATISTYNDHRIAMAFAVAGTRTPGIVIDDPECVSKTFPDFFERVAALS